MYRRLAFSGLALVSAFTAHAQQAVRALGPITRVSTAPLASVNTAVALSDGRVFANDVVSRRVLLFDSTLATAKVVADSTSVTAKAYGARPGTLFRYRGDTALFVDPASASMLVLSPEGKIARVLAMPTTGGRFPLPVANGLYPPGIDWGGRVVGMVPTLMTMADAPPGKASIQRTVMDSSFVLRFDLDTRTLDTIAVVRTVKVNQAIARDEDGNMTSLTVTPDILPMIDDWTTLPDGSVAIVRGRDYHVDWLGPDGKWRSSPKMSFNWQHLDDTQKTTLIDSALTATKARRDSMNAVAASRGSAVGVAVEGGRGGRGREGGPPGGTAPTLIDGRPSLSDLPDYRPAFTRGSTRADANGNLWIRTTTLVQGQPVYDVVDGRGVVDRVLLPPFRTIAGFGPGVVYMAVKDPAGIVHLERARIK